MICDFCSDPNPIALYPVEDFAFVIAGDESFVHNSVANWAACAECKPLLDAGDLDAIINRSLDAHLLAHPDLIADAPVYRRLIASLYSETFKRMTGQPVAIPSPTLDSVEVQP